MFDLAETGTGRRPSRPVDDDPTAGLRAALEVCALADRSDLGRILATGKDLLLLLHRLSTQDLKGIAEGEGRRTVLTTAKGRIVDHLFVHRVGPEEVLLVAGAHGAPRVTAHLARYTFREETGLRDVSGETAQFSLVGPRASVAMAAAGLPLPRPCASLRHELSGVAVHLLGQDGSSADGYSVVLPASAAETIWDRLSDAVGSSGGARLDPATLEAWRVIRGLGALAHEWTEDFNPLEAGLDEAVSFTKGCYVGQEVVARLRTYDKVSREMCGLVLPVGAPVPAPGTPVTRSGRRIGVVTSGVLPPGRSAPLALAYLKRSSGEAGELLIDVDGTSFAVVPRSLPFDTTP